MKQLCSVALLSGMILAGSVAELAEARNRTVPSRTGQTRATGTVMTPRTGERVESTMRDRLQMEDQRLRERTGENAEANGEARQATRSEFDVSDRGFREEVDGLDAVPTMRQEDRIELLSAVATRSNNPVIAELITARQELFTAVSEKTAEGRRMISGMMEAVAQSGCQSCAIGATGDLLRARDIARLREGSEKQHFLTALEESGKLREVRRRCNEFM